MMDYLLPIGSVVRLSGGEKRMMIFGIRQMDDAEGGLEYDYVGVLYPEGNLGTDFQFMFNHSDIEDIYFRGFEDVERQNFIKALGDAYRQRDNVEK